MPAVTYLRDDEVASGRSIPDDKEADELLQQLRNLTGEDWIVMILPIWIRDRWWKRPRQTKRYTLYADCHGEWQIMNLVTPDGGSLFHGGAERSREDVMNFMLGMIAGIHDERKHGPGAVT